jgi:hypothetical protein
MDNKFYYLDGKQQKGPYTLQQLRDIGIKADTLVWMEDFENWKAAKEIPELSEYIRKMPPPPPIIDNIQPVVTTSINKEEAKATKTIVEDSDVKFWKTIKILITIIFMFITLALISFTYVNNIKGKLRAEINQKVNEIFIGKSVVLDAEDFGVEGKLEEVNLNKINSKENYEEVNIDSDVNNTKNKLDLKERLSIQIKEELEYWKRRDSLHTVFICSSGGFTVKKLTKHNDESFDLEVFKSTDMGYRKPTYSYAQPSYYEGLWGERELISGGYKYKTIRPSVQKCYNKALEYFTKDDNYNAYTPGKFVDITNFPNIQNKYYRFENVKPKKRLPNGGFFSEWRSPDEHSANVYSEDYRVYHSLNGRHYELIADEKIILNDFLSIFGLSSLVLSILLFMVLLSKPNFFRNLFLYGKRWENLAYEDQIFFFEHNFFGPNTFTELINNTASKGVLKITDKGNTINLSYPNKELFYKIESIDMDNLKLISLKDNNRISFLRVGAVIKDDILNKENEKPPVS